MWGSSRCPARPDTPSPRRQLVRFSDRTPGPASILYACLALFSGRGVQSEGMICLSPCCLAVRNRPVPHPRRVQHLLGTRPLAGLEGKHPPHHLKKRLSLPLPIVAIPSSRRGSCMLSSNRWLKVHGSRPFLGRPSSSNFLDRASHFSHHSAGRGPRASTRSPVASSGPRSKLSWNSLWPRIAHAVHARLQMSDRNERGSVGSNRASGGRMSSGV